MGDDEAFLAAVVASPADDAPRLVYADWLDERGDARGEFLRLEARLAAGREATLADQERLNAMARQLDVRWVCAVCRVPVETGANVPGPSYALVNCLALPVPTAEQTARFAVHVADNHSWYKHLPFFPPGALFEFFPNPHAGRGVRADGDHFLVYDIEQGDYFAHHSRLPTAEYLAQFGHWDYWVDDNPRVRDPQPGPWLYSADGSHRELLADNLKRQWSCRLTAFLKPSPAMLNLRVSELQREADEFMGSGRRSVWRMLLGLFGSQSDEDPAVRRYREVAPALQRAAGLPVGDAALYSFMDPEARTQRESLLSTLQRVRVAWASGQGGSAEPNLNINSTA